MCLSPATAPARPAGAVHDARIQLDLASPIEDRAATGIEEWRILEDFHRGDRSILARAARFEHGIAGIERLAEVGAVLRLEFGGHFTARQRPCTTVNRDSERGFVRHGDVSQR